MMGLPESRYQTQTASLQFYQRLLDALKAQRASMPLR